MLLRTRTTVKQLQKVVAYTSHPGALVKSFVHAMSDNAAPIPTPAPEMKYTGAPGVDVKEYLSRWDTLWSGGLQVGQRWDKGTSAPSLIKLLQTSVNVSGKRVLVPGCGRGYDVSTFVLAGASHAVGLELSPAAAKEAVAFQKELNLPEEVVEKTSFVEGDFFKYEHKDGAFDVGYDYTFGCAMHPTMRDMWAKHWSRSLKEGGNLITLVFPYNPEIDPTSPDVVGPPFPVSPELYRGFLEPVGFRCVLEEKVPDEMSFPDRIGREVLMVWVLEKRPTEF